MARGRFISTSIALDPELNRATPEAQLLYLRCIPHLDRDGLILGQPAALWARVAPLMESLLPTMPRLLEELVSLGLVIRYDTRIGPVLFFKGFHKNQSGMRYDREGPSEYECPPGMERTPHGLAPVRPPPSDATPPTPAPTPELLRSDDGVTPPEVEVKVQVEVKEEVQVQEAAGGGTPESEPQAEEQTDARTEEEITIQIARKLDKVGVCLNAFTMEKYMALVAEVGFFATVAGIDAAATNGKQQYFNYVTKCARNKAQGIQVGGSKAVEDIPNTHKWDNTLVPGRVYEQTDLSTITF